jgi:branched-subunit amino acid transport protein
MTLWITVISIGVITYGIRLSFIALQDRLVLPPLAQRALRFVPVAILTAITVPALVYPAGTLDLSPGNARLLAGIVAALVAWRTRNVLLTIVAGLAALWVLIFAAHLH